MTTHVFMLHPHRGTRFLLGSSNDLAADLKYLAPSQFDLTRSTVFALPDPPAGTQMIGVLQHAFASLEAIGPAHPGMMWFELAALPRMRQFLEHVRDLMPHQLVRHSVQLYAEQERLIRQRWPEERLKQLHAQQEQCKLSAQVEAEQTGLLLARLFERSSFAVIVRTKKSYVLVGQARAGDEFYVNDTLDSLSMSNSGIDSYHFEEAQDETPAYYAAELSYVPGQFFSPTETWYGWCEHRVWAQQKGIPGLDATLRWQDAKRAAELLAKCPGSHVG